MTEAAAILLLHRFNEWRRPSRRVEAALAVGDGGDYHRTSAGAATPPHPAAPNYYSPAPEKTNPEAALSDAVVAPGNNFAAAAGLLALGVRSTRRRVALAAMCATLAGCGTLGGAGGQICPRVDTLDGAERVTQFNPGPTRDLTDIRFEGNVVEITTECDYDRYGTVEVSAIIAMVFVRGPAAPSEEGRFQYFVAITDPSGRVVAKRSFPIEVAFVDAATRISAREELTQRFSYSPADDARGYRIYVGFQLTRDQLDYEGRRRR